MNSLDRISEVMLPLVVTYLMHSTLLLSGCWLFLFLHRRHRKALADRCWKLAAVAGLVTTSVQLLMATPLQEVSRPVDDRASETMVRRVDRGPEIEPDQLAPSRWIVRVYTTTPPPHNDEGILEATSGVVTKVPGADRPRSHRRSDAIGSTVRTFLFRFATVLILIWVALESIRFVLGSIRLRHSIRKATSCAEGDARRIVDRLHRRHSRWQRSIRLLMSAHQTQPVAFGGLRPTILLPSDIESRLSRKELEAVLSHEVGHLVRGDVAWLAFGRFLAACLPFQPLNRLAQRRWQSASEYLCDQWAIGRGVAPLTLARGLTEVASWQLERRSSRVALSAACPATVIGRVRCLTGPRPAEQPWRMNHHFCFVAIVGVLGYLFVSSAPCMAWARSTTVTVTTNDLGDADQAGDEWNSLRQEMAAMSGEIDHIAKRLSQSSMGPAAGRVSNELLIKKELLMQRFQTLQSEFSKESDR